MSNILVNRDGQGIQNFYDAVIQNDFARDHQFRIIQLGVQEIDAALKEYYVYLTTATLPAREIASHAVPFMGLQFNVPGSASYPGSDSWAVNFRCPADYNLRDTLTSWTKGIFDDEVSTGAYNIPSRGSVATLGLLDAAGNVIEYYNLYGLFIRNIGELNYDITGNGAPLTFTATFAYQYWRNLTDTQFQQVAGSIQAITTDATLG